MSHREILADIHALDEGLDACERKYGILSETLCRGEAEPGNE